MLRTLSSILWHERELVGEAVDAPAVRIALHTAELDRAIEVQRLAESLDLDGRVTLRELASRLPQPWRAVLGDHHAALLARGRAVLPRSLADFLR